MYKSGHSGISALLASPFILIFIHYELFITAFLFGFGILLLSSFPDIDLNISSLNHRGFTHTVHFAVYIALVYTIVYSVAIIVLFHYYNPLYTRLLQVISYPIFILPLIGFSSGFLGIVFHLCGDIVTPSGVNLYSNNNRGGISLNITKASNEPANKHISLFGLLTLLTAIISGYNTTQQTILLYILLFSVTIISWIIISTTRLGKILY